MADNDSMQRIQTYFKNNPHMGFAYGLGAILLVRLLIFMADQGATAPETPEPTAVRLESEIDTTTNEYRLVEDMLQPMEDFNQSEYHIVAKYNMFDPKVIPDAAKREEQANELYGQARTAWRAGNPDEALRLLDLALEQAPSHRRSHNLKQEIQEALGQATRVHPKMLDVMTTQSAVTGEGAGESSPTGPADGAAPEATSVAE